MKEAASFIPSDIKMVEYIEVQLFFNADNFFFESLIETDLSEPKAQRIVDSCTSTDIGKIIFTTKLTHSYKTMAFENLKNALKRMCPSSRHDSKRVTYNSQQKAAKLTVARPEASSMSGPAPQKIDVSSMLTVMQDANSDERSYKCSFCGSECTHLTSMRRHIETKHLPNSVSYSCLTCDYISKHKFVLKKHYMAKHGMPEPAAQAMMVNY